MLSHPKVVNFLRRIHKQKSVLNHINSKTKLQTKKKKEKQTEKKCPEFWNKLMCSHMEGMFMNTVTKNIPRHNFANGYINQFVNFYYNLKDAK